jgi:hypothetical protein
MSPQPGQDVVMPAKLPFGDVWNRELTSYLDYLGDECQLQEGGSAISHADEPEGWMWMDSRFRTWMASGRVGIFGTDIAYLSKFLRTLLMRSWLGSSTCPLTPDEVPRVAWVNTAQTEIDFCASWVNHLARLQSPQSWVVGAEAYRADALIFAVESLRKVPFFPIHRPGIRPVDLIVEATDAATEHHTNTLVVDGFPDSSKGGRSRLLDMGAGEFHEALLYISRTYGTRIILLLPDPTIRSGGIGYREAFGVTENLGMCLTQVLDVRLLRNGDEGVQVTTLADLCRPTSGTKLPWQEALK